MISLVLPKRFLVSLEIRHTALSSTLSVRTQSLIYTMYLLARWLPPFPPGFTPPGSETALFFLALGDLGHCVWSGQNPSIQNEVVKSSFYFVFLNSKRTEPLSSVSPKFFLICWWIHFCHQQKCAFAGSWEGKKVDKNGSQTFSWIILRIPHKYIVRIYMGSTVVSWLVCSTPERVLQVWALARDIVLCSWARHLTLTVQMGTGKFDAGGVTQWWASIPSRGE